MKRWFSIGLLVTLGSFTADADERAVIEVEVHGMVCAFCAEGLRRNLRELPGVASAEVSLARGRARIVLEPGREIDPELLKRTVVEAGYTAGDVHPIP